MTRSLLAALRRVRGKEAPVLFWIDQLCINQEDLEERARQVGLMQEIYALAKVVYVWLGSEREDSDLAISFLPWLSALVRKHGDKREGISEW